MGTTLSFLGAAGTVTGSRYLVRTPSASVLVDCGLFQERELASRNWEPFPVPPAELDAVLLTHAHVDHCGLLPRLVRQGFRGPIWATPATADLARILLEDSARIQAEDVEWKRRRHIREGRRAQREPEPLYTAGDVERTLPLFNGAVYGRRVSVARGVHATLHEAGHLLGSAMVKLELDTGRTLLFSGDIGRWDKPIIGDPTLFDNADDVVMECTYGDKVHEESADLDRQLEVAILGAVERGGNVVMPSFAVGRTQEVLYHLSQLQRKDRIPRLVVFIDSPMAVEVTGVFARHAELYDPDMAALVRADQSPFDFPNLRLVSKTEDSKAINSIRGTAVIVAGSGMCNAGRVKHHLVHNISRPESTILFVGYQAAGTLGREIVDGRPFVRIHGQDRKVRAQVVRLEGFSAHADQRELLRWAASLDSRPTRFFLTHGEPTVARSFAATLGGHVSSRVIVPAHGDVVALDEGGGARVAPASHPV